MRRLSSEHSCTREAAIRGRAGVRLGLPFCALGSVVHLAPGWIPADPVEVAAPTERRVVAILAVG